VVLLGLILLAGSAAFTGLAIAYNLGGGPHYTVHMLGATIATLNSLAIFCAGLALALIFSFGLWLLSISRPRRVRRRPVRRAEYPADAYDDSTVRPVDAPAEPGMRRRHRL
jgi:hypothetical protein